MPVTTDEFLNSAKALLLAGAGEINARNAASQAYYAAYHDANLLATGLPVRASDARGNGRHETLIRTLKGQGSNPFAMKCIRVGILLSQIRAVRVVADYELREEFSKPQAQVVVDSVPIIRQAIAEADAMKA